MDSMEKISRWLIPLLVLGFSGCSTLSVCVEKNNCASFTTIARDYSGIMATYDGKKFTVAVGESATNPELVKMLMTLPLY